MSDIYDELNAHLLALVLRNQLEILNWLYSRPLLVARPPDLVTMRVAIPLPEKEADNR